MVYQMLGIRICFFYKQKTAYEMRISDWSSDVCSSDLLAGTIASLPLMVYRTGRDGRRNVATDHPLYRVLHDSPNADQTAVDFWEFICACLEMHGNAYCETERAIDGRIIALSPPIIPELMSVRRLD